MLTLSKLTKDARAVFGGPAKSAFTKTLSSWVWLFFHLPSVIKGRLGRFVFSRYYGVLPSGRPSIRAFSKSNRVGVNLAGYMRAEVGLGQAARGIAAALESV